MEKEITELIEINELKKAKELIMALENKLTEESSVYTQSRLKLQISDLKEKYNSGINLNFKQVPGRIKITTDISKILSKDENKKLVFSNLKETYIPENFGPECEIEYCQGIETGLLNCENSIFISSVENSKIKCYAQQVRMKDCENVELLVFTKTGISLENCKAIKIIPIENTVENKYNEVFDFTSLKEKNYQIYDYM